MPKVVPFGSTFQLPTGGLRIDHRPRLHGPVKLLKMRDAHRFRIGPKGRRQRQDRPTVGPAVSVVEDVAHDWVY